MWLSEEPHGLTLRPGMGDGGSWGDTPGYGEHLAPKPIPGWSKCLAFSGCGRAVGGWRLTPSHRVLWDAWAKIPLLIKWGQTPSPNTEGPSRTKALESQAHPWGIWGPPPQPPFLTGGLVNAEAVPITLWPHPLGRAGKLGQAGGSPSPQSQRPSFLAARHLVLVPSKRMRPGASHFLLLKPAQPSPHQNALTGHSSQQETTAQATPLPATRNTGFPFILILRPFPALRGEPGPGLQSPRQSRDAGHSEGSKPENRHTALERPSAATPTSPVHHLYSK